MRIIFTIATIILTLAIVRFFDANIKKVIKIEVEELTQNNEKNNIRNDSLNNYLAKLDQEITLQELKTSLNNESDCYLELDRKTKQARLKMEDKVLREMEFDVLLLPGVQERSYLPSGILQILAKQESTNFYIPDFYYELLGESIPNKITDRFINNAFGLYALQLSGNLIIHGPIDTTLSKDLIQHNAIIFEPEDLQVIYHSLKPYARIVFY